MLVISVTIVLLSVTLVSGYNINCGANQTLFVPKGNVAIFKLIYNLSVDDLLIKASFEKTDGSAHNVLFISWVTLDSTYHNVYFDDKEIQNRTEIIFLNSTKETLSLEMKVTDLQLHDNGTYVAHFYRGIYLRVCWILLVLDLQQIPSGHISEDQGVRILGQPAASLMKRPVINATMIWLLDGKLLNETEYFVIQDGAIWAAQIPRALNGKNVTYRAIQDNGEMSEVYLTVDVTYGPDFPLIISPSKTLYTLNAGDIMPEIQCTTDCYPPCLIYWGKYSSTDVLRLGAVSFSFSGEYTCTARSQGNGTIRAVERTVYLMVIDNTSEKIGFAVLGSLQALTTLFFGISIVFFCRRVKGHMGTQISQQTGTSTVEISPETTPDRPSRNAQMNTAYTAAYEELNPVTVQDTTESERYTTIKREGAILKVAYENTRLSESS